MVTNISNLTNTPTLTTNNINNLVDEFRTRLCRNDIHANLCNSTNASMTIISKLNYTIDINVLFETVSRINAAVNFGVIPDVHGNYIGYNYNIGGNQMTLILCIDDTKNVHVTVSSNGIIQIISCTQITHAANALHKILNLFKLHDLYRTTYICDNVEEPILFKYIKVTIIEKTISYFDA